MLYNSSFSSIDTTPHLKYQYHNVYAFVHVVEEAQLSPMKANQPLGHSNTDLLDVDISKPHSHMYALVDVVTY